MVTSVQVLLIFAVAATASAKSVEFSTKIIGGVDAPEDEFTYTAAIIYSAGPKCTGTILTDKHILTAAHCCQDPPDTRLVMVGNHDRSLTTGVMPNPVLSFTSHPDYHGGGDYGMHNDICIAEVMIPIDLNDEHISQVTLAGPNFEFPDKSPVTAAGWGYSNVEMTETNPWLQVGKNYTASSSKWCADRYVNFDGSKFSDFEGQICILGHGNSTVCQGDSGGPVLLDDVQIGVFSYYTVACGTVGPDYYTKVAYYADWINKTVGDSANQLKFKSSSS